MDSSSIMAPSAGGPACFFHLPTPPPPIPYSSASLLPPCPWPCPPLRFPYYFASSSMLPPPSPHLLSPSPLPLQDLSLSLPTELLEKILCLLPISTILRSRTVCKRWLAIASSPRFLRLLSSSPSPSSSSLPWYFMYKDAPSSSSSRHGLAYDPSSKKWHSFHLPPLPSSSSFIVASSSIHGLVCFADSASSRHTYALYLCNPTTKQWRRLPELSPESNGKRLSDYHAVSLCSGSYGDGEGASSQCARVVVARSSQIPGHYSRWTLRIEEAGANAERWVTRIDTVLDGWRGGENSVVCRDRFFCVVHSTAMVGGRSDEVRHGLVSFDLCTGELTVASIAMPCCLTCAKLINCEGRLIMVGGIGRSDVVRGIGVWELMWSSGGIAPVSGGPPAPSRWVEISRMPNKFFRGFGEFDDVFSSSGMGDLVYVHAYGSPQLLVFSLRRRTWRWSQKCPMVKKHPLHLFTGFCFLPSLATSP